MLTKLAFLRSPASAGIVLLDQKAAFLSIAHEFLVWILAHMNIPLFFLKAIHNCLRQVGPCEKRYPVRWSTS